MIQMAFKIYSLKENYHNALNKISLTHSKVYKRSLRAFLNQELVTYFLEQLMRKFMRKVKKRKLPQTLA